MLNGVFMLEIVSNTGPVIHLAQIGRFDLLGVFSKIFIPRGVYEEISLVDKPGGEELKEAQNIKVVVVPPKDIENLRRGLADFKLDEGELQSLFLCRKLKIDYFFTDDLEARRAAKYLKLEVHGSAGIIALAYREGLIGLEEAKKALNDLYEVSSLFITKAIVDIATEELEKFKR